LITDGKTSDSLHDVTLLGETLIIDIEQSAVKRGNARKIADQLDAQYSALLA
jgi:magnesium chelatase subunit D